MARSFGSCITGLVNDGRWGKFEIVLYLVGHPLGLVSMRGYISTLHGGTSITGACDEFVMKKAKIAGVFVLTRCGWTFLSRSHNQARLYEGNVLLYIRAG